MKQKFQILKNTDKKQIIIQEYAELDKDAFSLLCEEAYDMKQLENAAAIGRQALMDALRTRNLYPIGIYTEKIADKVVEMLASPEKRSEEIPPFDDMDLISLERNKEWGLGEEEVEEESSELDELLEEEIDDDYDKQVVDGLQSSVQVADEDSLDAEDES
jgi:hypothetical protein